MSNDPKAPGAQEPASEGLQFEQAEFAQAQLLTCAVCKVPISGEYFQVNGKVVCANCRTQLGGALAGGPKMVRVLRALGAGLAAAVGGFLVYWAIRAATGYEFGLVAILVGWMVGVAVRWGANQRGGWFYQSMAVFLTYLSIASTYTPDVLRGMRQARNEPAPTEASAATNEVATAPGAGSSQEPAAAKTARPAHAQRDEATPLWFEVIFAFVFSLAVPFLMGFENVIGILIILFGLMQAWRLNKRVALDFSGPFSTSGTPPAAA